MVVWTWLFAAAGAGPSEEELHLAAVLAQFGQGLQWTLIGQKLALGVSQSLNKNVATRLTYKEHKCRKNKKSATK